MRLPSLVSCTLSSLPANMPAAVAAKLRVLQFSRSTPPDDLPTIMNIPRKALIDEINGPYAVLQSPANQSKLKVTFVTPRDIRKIDPAFATRLEPTILVRTGCIIVAFGRSELRVIVTPDALFCMLPPHLTPNLASTSNGSPLDKILGALHRNLAATRTAPVSEVAVHSSLGSAPLHSSELEENSLPSPSKPFPLQRSNSEPELSTLLHTPSSSILRSGLHRGDKGASSSLASLAEGKETGSSFEFLALEAVLMTVCGDLSQRQTALTEAVQRALLALRRSVTGTQVAASARQLDHVRRLKQQVRELLGQSMALEEELQEVLDANEDMEAMYLSRILLFVENADGDLPEADLHDHEEVEVILESYLQEVGATVAELEVLTYAIEGTEKFVSFRLDSAQNRLKARRGVLTASATTLGLGNLFLNLFGMNLPATIFVSSADDEDSENTGFWVAAGCITLLVTALLLFVNGWFGLWQLETWFGTCWGKSDEAHAQLGGQLGQLGATKGGARVAVPGTSAAGAVPVTSVTSAASTTTAAVERTPPITPPITPPPPPRRQSRK